MIDVQQQALTLAMPRLSLDLRAGSSLIFLSLEVDWVTNFELELYSGFAIRALIEPSKSAFLQALTSLRIKFAASLWPFRPLM